MAIDLLTGKAGNHIVNFPMVTDQNQALPEWWDEDGNNGDMTLTYEQDLLGVESVPDDVFPEGFKVVTGATTGDVDYVYQDIVLSDHDYLHVGDVVSASVWVYQPTSEDTITFELYANGAAESLRSVTTQVADSWTILKIQGVEVPTGTTSIEFRLSSDATSDTFYFTQPMFNLGKRVLPFQPNPCVVVASASVLTSSPPGGGSVSLDISSFVHPLAYAANITQAMNPNGFTATGSMGPGYGAVVSCNKADSGEGTRYGTLRVFMDDGYTILHGATVGSYTNYALTMRDYERWAY